MCARIDARSFRRAKCSTGTGAGEISPRSVRREVTNAALLPPRTAVRVGGAAIAALVAVLVTAAGAALRAVVALAKSTLLKLKTA